MTKNSASHQPSIFFSYSRDDSEFCLRLARDLKEAGIDIWMDQLDIGPGERWDDSVENAIKRASAMLVVLSPASTVSKNVRDEINYALEQSDRIFPVLYKKCDIPMRLARVQYVDFTGKYEPALNHLVKRLKGEDVGPLSPKRRILHKRFGAAAILIAVLIGGLYVYPTLRVAKEFTVNVGPDRTIPDVDRNQVESIVLKADTNIANVDSIEWKEGNRILGNEKTLTTDLDIGMHEIWLRLKDHEGRLYQDSVMVNVITKDQQEEIEVLLSLGESSLELAAEQFNEAYLTEGVSSAYAAFQQVLRIDSFNGPANAGTKKIADLYEQQARQAIKDRKLDEARGLLARGLKVVPDHPGLTALKAENRL